MRFVDDDELWFCLTISTGIKRDDLLDILGMVETLSLPHPFDDFVWNPNQSGKRGLLNVFEDGDFLITVENSGLLGVARRSINKVAGRHPAAHYVGIYHDPGSSAHQYVEVDCGVILANFDALLDEAPENVADFFPEIRNTRRGMIQAVERRMGITVQPEWLEKPTGTYVIDYRTERY
jgi:hypothetical protein